MHAQSVCRPRWLFSLQYLVVLFFRYFCKNFIFSVCRIEIAENSNRQYTVSIRRRKHTENYKCIHSMRQMGEEFCNASNSTTNLSSFVKSFLIAFPFSHFFFFRPDLQKIGVHHFGHCESISRTSIDERSRQQDGNRTYNLFFAK